MGKRQKEPRQALAWGQERGLPSPAEGGAYINDGICQGCSPASRPRRGRRGWYGVVIWVVVLGCIGGMLGRGFWVVSQASHMPTDGAEWRLAVSGFLLSWGLPDLHTSLWENPLQDKDEITTTTPTEDTESPTQAEESTGVEVVALDMSLWSLGAGHWQGERGCLPPAVTDLEYILTPQKQQVLVVCSHPYATYGTGEGWVEMTSNFAVEVTPAGRYPDFGVATLAEAFCEMLQDLGVDAVLLPYAQGETHTTTYQATSTAVEDYIAQHPDVGLVIDLGRSGELLSGGEVPRSLTQFEGRDVAQVQVVVDTGRGLGAGGDYTLAGLLRQQLFGMSPTLSRPVYLRRGGFLTSNPQVVCLTLSLGTAGNTFEEAEGLLQPLVQAFAELLPEKQEK